MIFGLLGGVPYLAASATTVYLAQQAGLATSGGCVQYYVLFRTVFYQV